MKALNGLIKLLILPGYMKPILATLALAAMLFSCNNSASEKKAADADTSANATAATTTAEKYAPSPAVLNALNNLKAVLVTRNKSSIADLFEFPMAAAVFRPYIDDSTFSEKYQAAGELLTKNLFLEYYDKIAKYSNLEDIIYGLEVLNVDSLRHTNEISKIFATKNEPCAFVYTITVEDEKVEMRFSINPNTNYVPSKKATDEETDDTGCEYSSVWEFMFDGQRLKFLHQAAAG